MEKLDKLLFVGVDGYVHGQPDMTDEIERTIKSALSAPARNCDRYKTAEDAHDAYDEITHADIEKYDECRQNCPMCDEKLYIPCEVKWLFAPATERKGE